MTSIFYNKANKLVTKELNLQPSHCLDVTTQPKEPDELLQI